MMAPRLDLGHASSMILHHLRSNAVAYLALAIALTTGTSYAAGQLANGSVTTKKLAKNAVTSSKIKSGQVKARDLGAGAVRTATVRDGSLTAADLAPGVVVAPAWAHVDLGFSRNPPANPDFRDIANTEFVAPRAGLYYIRFFGSELGGTCSAGPPEVGLSVDEVPIPGTSISVEAGGARADETLAVIQLTAGPHKLAANQDCSLGNINSVVLPVVHSWTVLPASG